jgi:hypothetical protein
MSIPPQGHFSCLIMSLAPCSKDFAGKNTLKVTLWGITHYPRRIPHIWRHVSPSRHLGKDTWFNTFYIFGGVALPKEVPCGMVDMV